MSEDNLTEKGPEGSPENNPPANVSTELAAVAHRCLSASIPIEWRDRTLLDKELVISIPNGRVRRELIVGDNDFHLSLLEKLDLGKYLYLRDYEAIASYADSYIEAQISGLEMSPVFAPVQRTLVNLARVLGQEIPPGDGIRDLDFMPSIEFGSHDNGWSLGISAMSDVFFALTSASRRVDPRRFRRPRVFTLKISGVRIGNHDDAHRTLESIANSLFFDLDLRYRAPLMLSKFRLRRYGPYLDRRMPSSQGAPELPRTMYAPEPLALYWYARSASGMPLLQYLAYYQVLEYYFPSYSRSETLRRVRQELRDPRFNLDDDGHIGRVIELAAKQGKGFGGERDQLRATIRACLDEPWIRSLVSGDTESEEYFTGKQQIRGVSRLDPRNKQADLRDQLAQRIYDLRCRIVHTKDTDEQDNFALLLPYSREADLLGPDIALIRTVAQEVLIAGGKTLHIPIS